MFKSILAASALIVAASSLPAAAYDRDGQRQGNTQGYTQGYSKIYKKGYDVDDRDNGERYSDRRTRGSNDRDWRDREDHHHWRAERRRWWHLNDDDYAYNYRPHHGRRWWWQRMNSWN